MKQQDGTKIEIYLDDQSEPLATYRPPARFNLDTSALDDGPHILRIIAIEPSGKRGIRKIPFEVRNGPGIDVSGLSADDVVEGNISVLINAYGGSYEEKWEPGRAETPAPIPTWAWIVFMFVVAWSMYYAAQQWKPTPDFANTPTYGAIQPATPQETAAGSQATVGQMGAQLYRTSCASCHQTNGQGVPNVFPPLAGDPVVTSQDPTEHIKIVLFGMRGKKINGVSYSAQMPAWGDQLSDREIAAVINHERRRWGNNAPTVTPDQVAAVRKKNKSRN